MSLNPRVVYHIGVTSLGTSESVELGALGGIQNYLNDLIEYNLQRDIGTGFIGKIYDFVPRKNLYYLESQSEITSTISFLKSLFFQSISMRIPENAIIHAHRPDHLAVFNMFKGYKSVLTLHGQQSKTVKDRKSKLQGKVYDLLERMAIRKANKIIAVDQLTRQFYINKYSFIKNPHKIYLEWSKFENNARYNPIHRHFLFERRRKWKKQDVDS